MWQSHASTVDHFKVSLAHAERHAALVWIGWDAGCQDGTDVEGHCDPYGGSAELRLPHIRITRVWVTCPFRSDAMSGPGAKQHESHERCKLVSSLAHDASNAFGKLHESASFQRFSCKVFISPSVTW